MPSTSTPHDLLLAEELLLLVLDDEKGQAMVSNAEPGFAGALLLDLAAGGWLACRDGKLIASADAPSAAPPEGVLGDALNAIRDEGEPRDAKHWVRRLPRDLKPLQKRAAQRLFERGVLAEERHKVLGLFATERYPEADPAPERALRERLRAELTGTRELTARTALLVPLLRAYRLVGKVVDKADRRAAEARAKEIAEAPGDVGGAVRAVLDETQAAVMTAVMAATTATMVVTTN